jgi:UDP-3-O-[3-hydroxymyristoyl] N-acetylglucosamine deacetylase
MVAKKVIKFSGVGIHSGKIANVKITVGGQPGIFFKRTDLKGVAEIPATWNSVASTWLMNTSIGVAPNQVQTIEHFMTALLVCGIDSATVEIDNLEFPIMDGGAKQFIEIFKKAGVCKPYVGKIIIIKKTIEVHRSEVIKQMPFFKRAMLWLYGLKTGRRENGFVRLSPDKRGFVADMILDYPDKIIGVQQFEFVFDGTKKSADMFEKEVSKSRTFGRYWDFEYLKKRNMAKGCDENNCIVLMDGKNDWEKIKSHSGTKARLAKLLKNKGADTLTPLYYPDEFVRHKLVDAIGDLYLSGGMIVGKLESYKGSHAMNNLLLRKLFADPSNYEIVDIR